MAGFLPAHDMHMWDQEGKINQSCCWNNIVVLLWGSTTRLHCRKTQKRHVVFKKLTPRALVRGKNSHEFSERSCSAFLDFLLWWNPSELTAPIFPWTIRTKMLMYVFSPLNFGLYIFILFFPYKNIPTKVFATEVASKILKISQVYTGTNSALIVNNNKKILFLYSQSNFAWQRPSTEWNYTLVS